MSWRCRILLGLGLLVCLVVLSGCLLNVFQTAKMLEAGDRSLLLGTGLVNISVLDGSSWMLTPQMRFGYGLSDTVNLGLQTGMTVSLAGGNVGWLGARGDAKVSIVDHPDAVSLAVGGGVGYGLHFVGWGVYAGIFLDVRPLPLFVAYQPALVFGEDSVGLWHDMAIGLAFRLAEGVRVLVEVDTRNLALVSYGLGFEISFSR